MCGSIHYSDSPKSKKEVTSKGKSVKKEKKSSPVLKEKKNLRQAA